MIKFGILKSQVENVLLESYKNDTFKKEVQNFKKLVLENKNINKIFYLYDDLTSNKGLNESIVNEYITECISIYENTINKITPSDIDKLKKWVGNNKTENIYESVDNLFSKDVLMIESRIQSKKVISETLKVSPKQIQENVNIPLGSMVNIANKTINTFIENLEESDKK
jgi:DNA replicative helicase MCM subunit Mcm2 (Cdc46/Mcm family)